MSSEALRAWMAANHLTIRSAAATLRVSPTSLQKWLKSGAPYHIGLAIAALSHGLEPFLG